MAAKKSAKLQKPKLTRQNRYLKRLVSNTAGILENLEGIHDQLERIANCAEEMATEPPLQPQPTQPEVSNG